VEERINANLKLVNQLIRSQPGTAGLDFTLGTENFERLDHHTEPWLGDYSFDYVARFALTAEANDGGRKGGPNVRELKEQLNQSLTADSLQEQLKQLFREVEVKEAKPAANLPLGTEEIRFHVTAKGTRVKSRQEWYHEPALFFGLL